MRHRHTQVDPRLHRAGASSVDSGSASARVVVTTLALLITLLVLGCLGQRTSSDQAARHHAEPSVDLAPQRPVLSASTPTAPSVTKMASPPPDLPPNLSPPPSCRMPTSEPSDRAFIRPSATGSGYEVELQSARGQAPRGLPLWLRLGAVQLRGARESPTVGEYGAVFQLSQSQFESLPDGAELIVLSSASGKGRCVATLDKSALIFR